MSFNAYIYPEKNRKLYENDDISIDKGISQVLEELYSDTTCFLIIEWNEVVVKLPFGKVFSQIFNQLIYEIPIILKTTKGKMKTSLLDPEFTVILNFIFDGDQMTVHPIWVDTPLSTSEQYVLDSRSKLEVEKYDFSLKWKNIFELIIHDLRENGYGHLEDVKECERVVKEIDELM